jgi:lytic murein transglycosylase
MTGSSMQIIQAILAWTLGASLAAATPIDISPRFIGQKGTHMANLTPVADTQGLQNWLAGFRPRAIDAGISAAVLDQALTGLAYDPDVIRRDRNQSEFTKTIWDYLDTAASDARVENGQAALKRHLPLFQKIEAQYGVDKEVIAAIWGLESAYGTFRGTVPTIQSLATLAYDGRRAAFFEGELLAALKILQSGDTVSANMQGSWAGAMGHTQFMPSSFLAYAVDFDGDGKRNIWGDDPADALASSAAYLAGFGWTKSMPWGLEITLPQGFDYDQTSERVKKPVAEWQALGVRQADGGDLPDHGAASVLLPGGARGAAFLIFSNFQVIERYNTADAYVIAVGHLADLLKGGARIKSGWPRDLRALTLEERLALQEGLTKAGFSTLGVDGKMGPNTIAAVKAFQKSKGIVPDGYPSLEILNRLQ